MKTSIDQQLVRSQRTGTASKKRGKARIAARRALSGYRRCRFCRVAAYALPDLLFGGVTSPR
ncbi:hypothetical protein J4734_27875 [Klebsiella pneumoniae]|uniref:Uncharacterized protein n=1 Tax=Klebsiella pneumoniae TaxID=573 RepID=A0A939SSS1_KLEPN|nr:hypothetical protein [Klebsiella pneumoniae]